MTPFTPHPKAILSINGGSSSIKFALYHGDETTERGIYGHIDRIGLPDTTLTLSDPATNQHDIHRLPLSDHKSAVHFLIDLLEQQNLFESIVAVGHRVVHGMEHTAPEIVTSNLVAELHRLSPCDPDHLPSEIELIEAIHARHPLLPQVACFDTAFHSTMPREARMQGIPRRFEKLGVRRYGFHGISYAYLMEQLQLLDDPAGITGRVILAHLGNGASLAAVRNGRSIDTSMAFTPAAGVLMSTRSGDIDPGLVTFLMRAEQLTVDQFDHLINHESGLLGVSERSSDMRDLLDNEMKDIRSAEAIELFCYQVKKTIGSFAAALGGLDTLVFAGGIGENAPTIRSRICNGLQFLGIKMSEPHNLKNDGLISTKSSEVKVRVICTNEEVMITRLVIRALSLKMPGRKKLQHETV